MSEASERLIASAKEAVAVAKGERPAARLYHNGHNYYPESDVRAAIKVVKAHLDKEWICEGCEQEHAFGCASCRAVLLKRELDGLASWIEDD